MVLNESTLEYIYGKYTFFLTLCIQKNTRTYLPQDISLGIGGVLPQNVN